MKFIFAFYSLLFLCSSIQAQIHITGKVNTNNKVPVGAVSLTLLDIKAGQNQSTKSDENGDFSFIVNTASDYQLIAVSPGYQREERKIQVVKDTAISIGLHVQEIKLAEVLITGAKAMVENTAGKVVYNVSTSIVAQGSDLLTAINQIPGIKVNSNEISVAGKGGVRVMINNRLVQMNGSDLLRHLQSISANQVSTIELVKNPSANYDAEGNAGLINIVLKQSKKQGYSGSVQLNSKRFINDPAVVYGTSNYWSINPTANLNFNSSKWSVFASGNVEQDHHLEGFQTDIYYPDKTSMQTDTGDYRHHGFSVFAGADYKLSSKTIIGVGYQGGRSIYTGSDHVNNPFYSLQGRLDSTSRTYASYHPVANNNAVNLHAVINLDTSGKKLLFNADYFNNYRTDLSNFENNTYLADGSATTPAPTRYFDTNKQTITVYTVKSDAEIPTNFAKLTFGGKLSFINNYSNAFYYNKTAKDELRYNTTLSNEFKYIENTQAIYFSMDNDLGKWKYQVGLRGELTETDGYSFTLDQNTKSRYIKLFPAVLLTYKANPDNSYSFTFGRRINRPSFWSLNPFKSLFTAYSYGEGNPYLRPEYNTNLELSHTYKNKLTSALFLNVTDNGFTNVTIASADTNFVYTKPLNFIKTYRYGVSENLAVHFADWLDNNNLFTFYHINASSAIKSITGIRGFGAYISTTNNIYFNKEKTIAAAVNFWYQFPEIENIGRADAYYKFDLGFKAVLKKKIDVSLIFNDAFASSATAISTTINGIRQKFTNFQLNSYVQLGISYRFGNGQRERNGTGNQEEKSRL